MSFTAAEHREMAYAEMYDKGEITLYRLNKATYDVIHRVAEQGQAVIVSRDGRPLVRIEPIE